jgi:hypothetical protein
MAEAEIFIVLLIYLALVGLGGSMIIGSEQDTFSFGYSYHAVPYTVTQQFYDKGVTENNANLVEVTGTWDIDTVSGLYPVELANRALIPATTSYEARAQFGSVRPINWSYTEKYWLDNINLNSADYFKILINSWDMGTASSYYYLTIEGSNVFIERQQYFLGVEAWNTRFGSYSIPLNTHKLNISYNYSFISWNVPFGDITVKIEDTPVFTIKAEDLGFPLSDVRMPITRQADIKTNIGSPLRGYHVNVLSHYEDVGVRQYNETVDGGLVQSIDYVENFFRVLTWQVSDTLIPLMFKFLFIGIPEVALFYIGFRLLRGGG